MNYFLNWLRSVRVSNLIFIFFLPFIIYFIAISRNYGKALKSILGIEENALSLLLAFLILGLIGIFVFITSLKLYKSIRLDVEIKDRISSHRSACIFLSVSILLFDEYRMYFSWEKKTIHMRWYVLSQIVTSIVL